MKLVIDLETTEVKNFQRPAWQTSVHMIGARDELGRNYIFHDSPEGVTILPDGTLADGVRLIESADLVLGHNILGFDAPVLRGVLSADLPVAKLYDTQLAAKVRYPNLRELDFARRNAGTSDLPPELTGLHSLKAWGWRIGNRKEAKPLSWERLTDEMITYNLQDVAVCADLYDWLQTKYTPVEALELESRFAAVLAKQQTHGVLFDRKAADDLVRDLLVRRAELDEQLHAAIPPFDRVRVTPKKKIRTEFQVTFNPGSRDHCAEALTRKYGWKPTKYTELGKPAMTELQLMSLPYPEAKWMAERAMVSKRLSMLVESTKKSKSWLAHVGEDDRIRGKIDPMGTVTSRCSHSAPNLGNIPSVKTAKPLPPDYLAKVTEWGTRCRSLFVAPKGRVLVGADASNLELRALAHYLAEWDDGAYARVVGAGDPHTANQIAGGFESRTQAKKFLYCWVYGAGTQKLAKEMGCSLKQAKLLAEQFLRRTPGLAKLKAKVVNAHRTNRYLEGLDGRRVPTRSEHAALNTLLQSFGSVVMKHAVVQADLWVRDAGLDAAQVLFVHDELQYECLATDADKVGKLLVAAIESATERFSLRCPLTGEFKIGNDWSATH